MASTPALRAKLTSDVNDYEPNLEVTISVNGTHKDPTISVEYSERDGGWGYAALKNSNVRAGSINPPFFISTDGYIYIASEVPTTFNLKIESVEVDVSDCFARAVNHILSGVPVVPIGL